MIHALKIKSEYFEAVISGEKLFEVRVNDRNYKVGDLLGLNEINKDEEYTDRSCVVYIDYILELGHDNLVVMSIKPVATMKNDCPKNPLHMTRDYSVPLVPADKYKGV